MIMLNINKVRIFTSVNSYDQPYYNVIFDLDDGAYSITLNRLYINTKDMTLYISDNFRYKVYDINNRERLNDKMSFEVMSRVFTGEGDILSKGHGVARASLAKKWNIDLVESLGKKVNRYKDKG